MEKSVAIVSFKKTVYELANKIPLGRKLLFIGSLFFLMLFQGCSIEDKDVILYPTNGISFFFFANDRAERDSIEANLAYGTYFKVHPQGSYKISFDVDPYFSSPILQLHRLSFNKERTQYTARRVRNLKATEINGRWEYSFVSEESNIAYWATTLLGEEDTYYQGRVENFMFEGEGGYSNSLSLNLIIVGSFEGTADSLNEKQLASQLLASFRKAYQGISIDTIYIQYAENHSSIGYQFPKNEPWLAGTSSDHVMLDELGGWGSGNTYNALDFVLVHRIDTLTGILGLSTLYSANLGGGEGSVIVLGTHMKINSGNEKWLESKDIVETAVHEAGHFFGLRHTTTTSADYNALGDYSTFEDGFDDTEWCSSVLAYAFAKKGVSSVTDILVNRPIIPKIYAEVAANTSFDNCPDASNIMFPYVTTVPIEGFSEEQLLMVQKNLSLFPH